MYDTERGRFSYNGGTCVLLIEDPSRVQREAVRYYTMAAEKGHMYAQFYLANKYSKGEGIPENKNKAIFWYKKAAEQGHVQAKIYQQGLEQILFKEQKALSSVSQ